MSKELKETTSLEQAKTEQVTATGNVVDKKKVKEIDYTIYDQGPCYIDPSLKKPGFEYFLVSNDAGLLQTYQRWGFEVVKEDDFDVGHNNAAKSSMLGGAVTVQSKCGRTLVLMSIETELHKRLQAHRESVAKKPMDSIGQIDGVDTANQYGAITFKQDK